MVMVSVAVSPLAAMLEVTSDSPSPKNSVWTIRSGRTIADAVVSEGGQTGSEPLIYTPIHK
jgi:hypothetical protein